ncbi:MAG: Hsp70 family protein, partial [Amphritea sp.]|nr:Hsp70 family protein [Amphritea sp.]
KKALGHMVVGESEKAKIALSNQSDYTANINLLSETVDIHLLSEQMEKSIAEPMRQIKGLIEEILLQGEVTPDVVYITGGSARSPIVRKVVESVLPNTPIASGNFLSSVTEGLARWANLCFR